MIILEKKSELPDFYLIIGYLILVSIISKLFDQKLTDLFKIKLNLEIIIKFSLVYLLIF